MTAIQYLKLSITSWERVPYIHKYILMLALFYSMHKNYSWITIVIYNYI